METFNGISGGERANILETHLKFIKIQLPRISYCKNQILFMIYTHRNDFTDDFSCFYFLIGTLA